jgi:NADH-ubiquinone oxidoreductase chain 1
MQRRVGPNVVGVYGTLQPFADGLKLLLKEGVIPSQGNQVLFLVSPFVSLSLAIIGWAGIPFAKGTVLADVNLGVLFILAISSFGVYGVLLAGWSANSKYAFLGSLRSSAQLVSYELPLAMVILIVVSITGCLSFLQIVEFQQRVWLIIPLLPVSLVWFTVILAETNRAPFDLPEAEQELIAGFMVEHSAIPFALFYLAEYGSILLMSTLTSIFFFGGYTVPVFVSTNPFLQSLSLGLKNTIFFHLFV